MTLKYNIHYEVASTVFLIILLFFMKLQYGIHSGLNKLKIMCPMCRSTMKKL